MPKDTEYRVVKLLRMREGKVTCQGYFRIPLASLPWKFTDYTFTVPINTLLPERTKVGKPKSLEGKKLMGVYLPDEGDIMVIMVAKI